MAFERSHSTSASGMSALPERAALLCLALWIGFAVVAAGLYSPAFTGPFISDDFGYIVSHPYTETLDAESLREMFDPFGPAKLYTASYAPVHLLLTAVERQLFGNQTLGYHLVNVGLHALAGVLLVVWLWQLGVGRVVATAAGLLFIVHPANVEAVAWASQLKTLTAMIFSLAALLCLRRSPSIATLLFLLALLSKSAALFALPTAAAVAWVLGGREGRKIAAWLCMWLLFGVAYAFPQIASFAYLPAVDVEAFDVPGVQLFTIASIGMRYVVMYATAFGVSAWQEPLPVLSPLDPWALGGAAVACLLLWRLVISLRARSTEAVFWVAAIAAFLPVSQIIPFATPMADRYLYFMLPGLIGGTVLLCRALRQHPRFDAHMVPVMAALGFALIFGFSLLTAGRAPLWQSESELLLDAALHYPKGSTASFMRARRAAQDGEAAEAVAELRLAANRGIGHFMALARDPGLAPLHDEPAFRELLDELAGRWIARAKQRGDSSQPELRLLGLAHMQRAEYREAVAAFEAALELAGPLDEVLQAELQAARTSFGG